MKTKREAEEKLPDAKIVLSEFELAGLTLEIKDGDITDESLARLEEVIKFQTVSEEDLKQID